MSAGSLDVDWLRAISASWIEVAAEFRQVKLWWRKRIIPIVVVLYVSSWWVHMLERVFWRMLFIGRFGITLTTDMVVEALHALQGHPEAGQLYETFINDILLQRLKFTTTTHEHNLY